MARRSRKKKQSSSTKSLPAIVGALCAIALLAGGYFILVRPSSVSANMLNAGTYEESPDSLRGSIFTVKGEVVKKLHYEEGVRQVIHVRYDNKQIPLIIPATVEGPNINTNQEYTFLVKAKNDAWLVVNSYTDK